MRVVLHCSDSAFGNAALIAKWHTLPVPHGRGWDAIGYHYVILNGFLAKSIYHYSFDGLLETGRPLDDDNDIEPNEYGAHTFGHNNAVGICLIGESGEFTSDQLAALKHLLKELKAQYGSIDVKQHSDLDRKKPFCAGFTKEQMKEYNEL